MTMTTTPRITDPVDAYAQDHAAFLTSRGADAPGFLRPIRATAIDRFQALGFPTVKDEQWRFTNVSRIVQGGFRWREQDETSLPADVVDGFEFGDLTCTRLVFVNGRYCPRPSHRRPLPVPGGVIITSLAHALENHRELVEPHLARYADYKHDAFAALNTAFLDDGAFVYIPQGIKLETPVHLLFVSAPGDEEHNGATGVDNVDNGKLAVHPRNLIIAGPHAEATILEDYVSLDDGVYFTNALTELVAGEGSHVEHYMLERENRNSYNVSTLEVRQRRNSTFASHSVLLGGALVRNNVHPVLDGEGCQSLINGLYIAGRDQHMDNHMRVEHARPHCDSRQFYRGILDDNAHTVFSGRIVVHRDAQKTDAKQSNSNLLLSDDAQADTMPQLEIYADDVKCTHGATVGQIDEDAIFYLRSRGISEETARAILIFAFAEETLDRMKLDPVRQALQQIVLTRLPQGSELAKLA